MRLGKKEIRSKYWVFICLLVLGGCFLQPLSVSAQPGSRLKTHPREQPGSRPNRKRVKKADAPPSEISLWVVTNPSLSKVFLNGELRGETNAAGELELKVAPAATYIIRGSQDGYITREAEVEVSATPEAQQIDFPLPLALVNLTVITELQGVEVYLDDIYKGVTGPNGILVLEKITPLQPHTIRTRKDGYVSQPTPVIPNSTQVSIKLVQDSISLKVITDPPEAEVYLDEAYKGTSTSEGILIIEQVNPNQRHTVRARKEGHQQKSQAVTPGSSQVKIDLPQDPVVLMVRQVRFFIAENRLPEAIASFNQLAREASDHPELPRLSESILLGLQSRTAEMLKRVESFGLALDFSDFKVMNSLYQETRTWRPADEAIESMGKYWQARVVLLNADRAESPAERESLQRNARSLLSELSERNFRNPYLTLDLGWSWWKLKETAAAQKQFKTAQELKPDWAHPYFALGFLALEAAENQRAKSAKVMGYNQALDNFTKAISLKHDFAIAYALKSVIFSQLKKYDDAIAVAMQAVAVDPKSAYAHYALGYAYFEKGKSGYRNSLNAFNQAIALGGADFNQAMKSAIQLRVTRINQTLK